MKNSDDLAAEIGDKRSQAADPRGLRSTVNRTALGYYLDRSFDDSLPGRRDIDPSEMVPFLAHVILIDVIRDPAIDFRFRLVGTYYNQFWSNDPTGKRLSSLPGQGPGSAMWQNLLQVIEIRQPTTTTIPYVGPKRDIFDAEDCVMPLSGPDGSVDMLMVTCEYLPKSQRGI